MGSLWGLCLDGGEDAPHWFPAWPQQPAPPRQGPPFSNCHYLTPDAVLSSLCRRRGRTVPSARGPPPASVFSSAHTPRFSPSAAQPLAPNSLTRSEALCQCTGMLGTGVDLLASRDSPVLPQGTFTEEQTARCCSDLEDEPGPGGWSWRTATWAAQGCSERDVRAEVLGCSERSRKGLEFCVPTNVFSCSNSAAACQSEPAACRSEADRSLSQGEANYLLPAPGGRERLRS